jgi:hypothetical protein
LASPPFFKKGQVLTVSQKQRESAGSLRIGEIRRSDIQDGFPYRHGTRSVRNESTMEEQEGKDRSVAVGTETKVSSK